MRISKRVVLLGAASAAVLSAAGIAYAQTMITLGRGQTYVWRGQARGEVPLPGCRLGHYAQRGGLVINYAGGDPRLVFRTQSDGDPVMCITGPSGSFFNDDTNGLNPEITIPNPPPGMYIVRIGTYRPGGQVQQTTTIAP
jgi:hypothetical protein